MAETQPVIKSKFLSHGTLGSKDLPFTFEQAGGAYIFQLGFEEMLKGMVGHTYF